MIPLLITNEVTNVCVKVNKVETTDFTYNLTFMYNNHSLTTILSKLKGSTFHVLSDTKGNTIIALPLEGWCCTEISEKDYAINNKRTPLLMLENALHYKSDDIMETRTIMVTYCEDNVQTTKICKIKCMNIPNGIAANITYTCEDESMYRMAEGVKLKRIFRNFGDIMKMYEYLIKSVFYREDKIVSIDEVTTAFCEF